MNAYSIGEIFGMAIGIGCGIAIGLWVRAKLRPEQKFSFQNLIIGVICGLVILVWGVMHSRPVPFDQKIVEASKKINLKLPMVIDSETRLESTRPGPGNRLTYFYTLVQLTRAEVHLEQFNSTMRAQIIKGYQTNPGMASFRKNLTELVYEYRDKNNEIITTLIVSPKDFPANSVAPNALQLVGAGDAQKKAAVRPAGQTIKLKLKSGRTFEGIVTKKSGEGYWLYIDEKADEVFFSTNEIAEVSQ